MRLLVAAVVLLLSGVLPIFSAPPAWWFASDTGFIDPDASHSNMHNYNTVNVGQIKKVATQAKKYLDKILPGGAGTEINTMIASWSTNTDSYAPANLGQLKAVAKPFYTRLVAIGYNTKANLIVRGYPANWAYNTPWNPGTATAENYAPANLGQLKMAFSFDLSTLDFDNDNLPDEWEYNNNSGGGPNDDPDGDGLTNLDELANGTDPTQADSPEVNLSVQVIVQ
jgi:hypothetical protein